MFLYKYITSSSYWQILTFWSTIFIIAIKCTRNNIWIQIRRFFFKYYSHEHPILGWNWEIKMFLLEKLLWFADFVDSRHLISLRIEQKPSSQNYPDFLDPPIQVFISKAYNDNLLYFRSEFLLIQQAYLVVLKQLSTFLFEELVLFQAWNESRLSNYFSSIFRLLHQ